MNPSTPNQNVINVIPQAPKKRARYNNDNLENINVTSMQERFIQRLNLATPPEAPSTPPR